MNFILNNNLNGFLEVLVEEVQGNGQILSVVAADEFLEVSGVTSQVADGLGVVFNELFFEVLSNLRRYLD